MFKFPSGYLLYILCGIVFSDAFSLEFILPYVYFMVMSLNDAKVSRFGIAEKERDKGYYVGIIVAAYPLGQMLSALAWNWLSDRIGRRPVLLVGLFGSAMTCLLFGFVNSFGAAVFVRFLNGIMNGQVAVAYTTMSEGSTAVEMAFGFSAFAIMFELGGICNSFQVM